MKSIFTKIIFYTVLKNATIDFEQQVKGLCRSDEAPFRLMAAVNDEI